MQLPNSNDEKKKRLSFALVRLTVAFAKHGAGAGVDSVREQEKPEARKMLENAQTPTSRVHAVLGVFVLCKTR